MRHPRMFALIMPLTVGAALLAGARMVPAPALAQGQTTGWGERAELLLPRSEISVAQDGGRIFAIGGYPGTRITSSEVQVYDSQSDTWSMAPALPQPLHHTMAAVVNGRLYVIGGESGNPPPAGQSTFQPNVYVLDEAAGTWVQRASMPTARSGGGAAVIDGKIYVAGGRPPRGHDFAVYDPSTDQWTELPELPTQRNHLAVAAIDGKVYVAGGRFGGGVGSEMTDIVEIYDPRTNAWTTGARMLAPRAGMAAAAWNGCLYTIGGEGNDADPRGIFDNNEVYDPSTATWRSLAPMPLPTHGLTGAAALAGGVYIPAGATTRVSGDDVSSKLQVYYTDLRCGG